MKTKKKLYALALYGSILLIILLSVSQEVISYTKWELDFVLLFIMVLIFLVPLFILFLVIEKIEEKKDGQPKDDEFTNLIKYKSGYYAFRISLTMWLVLVFMSNNSLLNKLDRDVIILLGVFISANIYLVSRIIIIKRMND